MTDKKTETSQDDSARSMSPVLTTPRDKRQPPGDGGSGRSDTGSRSVLAPVALAVALVAAGFSGVLWWQHRVATDTQFRLGAELQSAQVAASKAAEQARVALERLEAQQGRIDALQSQLAEAGDVIRDLDEAFRTLTDRGSELVLLNDVEHLATIAQQQLQLGGNVRNAIVALESAQAQLARANRPALASLLQTINGDLDRLRAASTIDVAAFSHQLEELAMLLTEAPLVVPDESGRMAQRDADAPSREQPAPTVPPADTEGLPWWERALQTTREWSRDAWSAVRADLGQFIDVRRVDDASALLMSPDQAARFRENLRTRVMTAQLALMMRQPEVWRTEIAAVVNAIETRYDESSPLTRKALRLARSMADASIDEPLPTVDNTLQAINATREAHAGPFGGSAEPAHQESSNGNGDVTAESPASQAPSDEAGAPEPQGAEEGRAAGNDPAAAPKAEG